MMKEFKEFILRGNVVDMAVGVVIGAAFKAIVDSLVADIIMPLVGMLTAGVDFSKLKILLQEAVMEGTEIVKPEVAISYGKLMEVVLNFLIVALCIFLLIKGINKLRRKKAEEEVPAEAPTKTDEVLLLEEIRDALKKG